MNRNTNDFRDVEIQLYTNRIFVTNGRKHIFRRSGVALKVTRDFYDFFLILYFIIHDVHKIHNYICHYLLFSLCTEFHTVRR